MNKNEAEVLYFQGFYIEIYLRLRKYLKKTFRNPKWLLMSIIGRFSTFRYIAKKFTRSSCQRHQYSDKPSEFHDINVLHTAECLKNNGIHPGIQMSPATVEEILDFACSTHCYANLDPNLGFLYSEKEKVSREISLFSAQYFNTGLMCSAIKELSKDPILLEIAAKYLGAEPVFTGSRLWWNFVVDNSILYDVNKTITYFHYDLDDYACLRFFFYLTDVDQNSGPHVCVRGSHANKKLSYLLSPVKRRSSQSIDAYYGSENIITLEGRAGYGFAEDTFCFHKATRPLYQDRLMLQIQFAINDYGVHNDLKNPSQLMRFKY